MALITVTCTHTIDLDKVADSGRLGQAALLARLARDVDGDNTLDQSERNRRIAEAKHNHFKRLGRLSGKARQAKRHNTLKNDDYPAAPCGSIAPSCPEGGQTFGQAAD
jgi:hypothetical protein